MFGKVLRMPLVLNIAELSIRILNMFLVLNVSEFWIYRNSEHASGFEDAMILNRIEF